MPDSAWVTAGVGAASAVLGGYAKYFYDRRVLDYQLRRQHDQEERNKRRKLISQYQGRILEAGRDWDRRMVQIYDGRYADLDPPDDERLSPEQYYYQSVVFRFLQLAAIARRFESEAFYIRADIAKDEDFDLLRYERGFLWVMIHAEITPDDGQPGKDHFRSDAFRPLLDMCYAEPKDGEGRAMLPETHRNGELLFDRQRCLVLLTRASEFGHGDDVNELLRFFDGIRPDDGPHDNGRVRRRWDRIVALHLLVLCFVAKCGYRWHADDYERRVEEAVSMLLYPDTVESEFAEWLPGLGLETQSEVRKLRRKLELAANAHGSETDGERVARVLEVVAAHDSKTAMRSTRHQAAPVAV